MVPPVFCTPIYRCVLEIKELRLQKNREDGLRGNGGKRMHQHSWQLGGVSKSSSLHPVSKGVCKHLDRVQLQNVI